MTYIWWTHPKKAMMTEQRGMTPPRSNLSVGVSGAALSPANAKTVILAREIITPRIVPKTTPSSKIQRRRMEKPAPLRERQTGRKRMIITCPPSKDEASLGDDEFVVPEDPVEQERFKHRLMATTSSLKKKQQ